LTNEQIEDVERRLRDRRMRAQLPADPIPPPPGTWEYEAMVAEERKRQERIAAAKALEAEQIAAREAEEQRRREEWERNRPVREREALEQVKRDLAQMDAEREQLIARQRELEGHR